MSLPFLKIAKPRLGLKEWETVFNGFATYNHYGIDGIVGPIRNAYALLSKLNIALPHHNDLWAFAMGTKQFNSDMENRKYLETASLLPQVVVAKNDAEIEKAAKLIKTGNSRYGLVQVSGTFWTVKELAEWALMVWDSLSADMKAAGFDPKYVASAYNHVVLAKQRDSKLNPPIGFISGTVHRTVPKSLKYLDKGKVV